MWRCKECGGIDFRIEVIEEFRREGKFSEKGIPIIEESDDTEPKYSKDITYECKNCCSFSYSIEDIAEREEEEQCK